MRSVKYGCSRTRSISPGVSGPRLSQIAFDTPSRPRSWTSPARRSVLSSESGSPRSRAAAPARSATPREWPIVYGRLQVDEVADRVECCVELDVGELHAEGWFDRHHRVPAAHGVELVEQVRRHLAEELDELRVELGPAARPGHGDRGVDASDPVEDLDDVGEVHQPGGHQDLRAAGPVRLALAVPALEGLLDAVADALVEAEPPGQRLGRAPVVVEHRVHGAAAITEEGDAEAGPLPQGPARSDVSQDERRALDGLPEIDLADVVLHRLVVTEPFRLLVGVDVARHPRQHRGVVDDLALRRREPDALGQPQRHEALPQHVLHRMTHAQIGAQRQRRQQLGEPDTGSGRGATSHGSG